MAIISEDDKTTQLISVMGIPQCDIVYYFARALNAIKKKVLVVDNSRYHELFKSINKPDEERMVQTGNIYYVQNVSYSEKFFSTYDFVIIYHGMDIRDELNVASDVRYIVTDYNPITTQRLKSQLSRQEESLRYHVVYRNKVSGKIQEKMILHELGFREKNVKESYIISMNDIDELNYQTLLRNGIAKTKAISAEMKDIITSLYTAIYPEVSPKVLANYTKAYLNGKLR